MVVQTLLILMRLHAMVREPSQSRDTSLAFVAQGNGICLVLALSPVMLYTHLDTSPALSWSSVLKLHLSCLMQVWPFAGSVHPGYRDNMWTLPLACKEPATALHWNLTGTCRSSTTVWNWPWSGSSTTPRRQGQVPVLLLVQQRRPLPTRSSRRASRASSTGRSRRRLLHLR